MHNYEDFDLDLKIRKYVSKNSNLLMYSFEMGDNTENPFFRGTVQATRIQYFSRTPFGSNKNAV